jgi:hypothetical protein
MRRWTLRLSLALLALLVVATVTVQAVLMTDLPKRIVLGQIQKQLGLKVAAASLRTGWTGNTALRGVTLSLPLADDSFLVVPRMTVRHTSLPVLLLTRSVTIDAIELDQPNLAVRRDAAGRWNVADVAELVARAGGKQNQTAGGAPKLPAIRITEGTVVVNDATIGKTQTFTPLNVTGQRDGTLVYRYDARVSDRVSLVGQVAPGAPWKHEVDATLQDVAGWLKPWVARLPDNATVKAEWRGQLNGEGHVEGRLQVAQLRAGDVTARGALMVRDNGDGSVTAEPAGLDVTTGQAALPEVRLASGRVIADGKGVRAERLLVSGIGGQARVDGSYALLTSAGELAAEWTDLVVPKAGLKNLSGALKAELSTPFPGRPQVKARLTTGAMTPDGPFAATLVLDGTGRAGWGEMDWRVTAENLDWNGNYPLSFDGAVARVETTHKADAGRAPILRLLGLEKPGEPVDAAGELDLATGAWKAWLNAGAIDLPRSDREMALAFNAWGTRDYVRLEQFYVRVPEIELWSQGWYVFNRPKPVELDVVVAKPNETARRGAAAVASIAPGAPAAGDDAPAAAAEAFAVGALRAEFHLSGTAAAPRDLELAGKVRAADLRIGGRPLDDVIADVTGHVDNARAAVVTEQLELLKGRWNVEALYDSHTRGLTVGAKVRDLPAASLAQLAKVGGAQGTIDGDWSIHLPSVVGGFDRLGMNGSVVATGLKAGAFAADRIDARTSLDRGTLYVNDVRMTRHLTRPVAPDDEAPATDGRIDASAKVSLRRPSQFTVAFMARDWPVRVDSMWVDVSGGTEQLAIDVDAPAEPDAADRLKMIPPTLAARGKLALTARVTAGRGTELARADVQAALNGRELDLQTLRVQTAGGFVEGRALLDADYPLGSTARVEWRALDSLMLADLFPAAVGLGGTYSGSLDVKPATDTRRGLEPLAISLDVVPENGRYRDVEFGEMRLRGYTNLERLVLADLTDTPSELHVAGGVIQLWGRLSSHEANDTRAVVSTQVTAVLKDLSLDQIVKTGKPDADPMPGRLNGRLMLIGSTRPLRETGLVETEEVPAALERLSKSISAQGKVELSQSDLANVDAFAALYNLMSLGQDMHAPTGSGSAEVRMEGGALHVNNLRYYNRGTEIRAMASIDEIWRLPKSPLTGTAVGNARPFSEVKLPLFSTFDRVLTLAQPTGVAIGGTVDNPRVRPTAFDDVGDAMKAFVIGDARKATGK